MQIAILLFDQVTALDAIGPYEVLNELPGAEVIFTGIPDRTGPDRERSAWPDGGRDARRDSPA